MFLYILIVSNLFNDSAKRCNIVRVSQRCWHKLLYFHIFLRLVLVTLEYFRHDFLLYYLYIPENIYTYIYSAWSTPTPGSVYGKVWAQHQRIPGALQENSYCVRISNMGYQEYARICVCHAVVKPGPFYSYQNIVFPYCEQFYFTVS